MSNIPPIIRPWSENYTNEPEGPMFTMPPKIIYRYLNIKRVKQVISEKRMWFASPSTFNDPFDMYEGLIDFTVNKQRAKDFANRNKIGQSRTVRRTFAKDVLKRQQELIHYQKGIFADTKATSGVCCFGKYPDVTLMWSHYADSHKGAVIGFNIDPLRTDAEAFFTLQPVRYTHEVKAKNYYDEKERILMHWIYTKSAIWEYENEVRAFCLYKNGLIDFAPECIKEIYFGCNTSEKDIKEINDLIKEHNYKGLTFKKMQINPKTFNIKAVNLK